MKTILRYPKKTPFKQPSTRTLRIVAMSAGVTAIIILTLPVLQVLSLTHRTVGNPTPFPVTVNAYTKTITESPDVEAFLVSDASPLQAAVANAGSSLGNIFTGLATGIANTSWYQALAAVDGRFVTITPGLRKEQVAALFGDALSWNPSQRQAFMTASTSATLPLTEGSFAPGLYLVGTHDTPEAVQNAMNQRFTEEVLDHYPASTNEMVPFADALTIASIIQRETIGTNDMRLVSGVIWNRLFTGMKLQVDATVQYAKANNKNVLSWWPPVVPKDLSRQSLYNTYLHTGLPPTPIANPSVAAILAALNPVKTSCFYYFNDPAGNILCTDTYADHVALLKKYYGRGK